jgi:hypothetical protein
MDTQRVLRAFWRVMQKSSVELVGQERGWQVVVMCMWQDEIKREGDRMVYQSLTPRRGEENRPGTKERLENLKWAREHCDGLARVVVMRANDTKAGPRSIAECFPHDKLVMRITHINEATGEFRAESA